MSIDYETYIGPYARCAVDRADVPEPYVGCSNDACVSHCILQCFDCHSLLPPFSRIPRNAARPMLHGVSCAVVAQRPATGRG